LNWFVEITRREGSDRLPGRLALGADQREQALMILAARRTAIEVCSQPGKVGVGVGAGDLEVDVLVEQLETLLARDLESRRAQHPLQSITAFVI
jgi:hypothetical protein